MNGGFLRENLCARPLEIFPVHAELLEAFLGLFSSTAQTSLAPFPSDILVLSVRRPLESLERFDREHGQEQGPPDEIHPTGNSIYRCGYGPFEGGNDEGNEHHQHRCNEKGC